MWVDTIAALVKVFVAILEPAIALHGKKRMDEESCRRLPCAIVPNQNHSSNWESKRQSLE